MDDILLEYPQVGVVGIFASTCWALSQTIERSPTEINLAHCDIVGEKGNDVLLQFQQQAEWLRQPS